MPIYDFICEKDDCELKGDTFEEMLLFSEVEEMGNEIKVDCPSCNCKEDVVQYLNVPGIGFTSSKLENFEYRAGHNMAKAKRERRAAAAQSHMGAKPHMSINDIDKFGEGVHHGGKDFDDTKKKYS